MPLGSGCAAFEGLPPVLGVSIFDLIVGEGSGGSGNAPVGWQCSVPMCLSCPVYAGRTVGIGPRGWIKPIELS